MAEERMFHQSELFIFILFFVRFASQNHRFSPLRRMTFLFFPIWVLFASQILVIIRLLFYVPSFADPSSVLSHLVAFMGIVVLVNDTGMLMM